MTQFEDRERGQETKFVLEAAKEFRAAAKRNKALGHWAAEIMGRSDPEKYAQEVITADMEEKGEEDVFRKLRRDFDTANADVSDATIREKMAFYLKEARSEVYGLQA